MPQVHVVVVAAAVADGAACPTDRAALTVVAAEAVAELEGETEEAEEGAADDEETTAEEGEEKPS